MSIGNTKDQGNKGNNFAYQRSVLKLLSEIACSGGSDCCPTAATEATLASLNSKFISVVRIPSLLRVNSPGAGSIASGARSVSVLNSGITNGSWLGSTIKPGEQFSYDAGGEDDVLGLFTYNALTTELVITTTI